MLNNGTYRYVRFWFPVLLYCLAIFIQSSYPSVKQTQHLPHEDKVLHFVGYAFLGVLFLRGFRNSRFGTKHKFVMAASILLTGLYGVSDELHQLYVPLRDGNIQDALFDFLGGIFGVYLYQTLSERYPNIRRI